MTEKLKLLLFSLFSGPYKRRLFANYQADPELKLIQAFLQKFKPDFIDIGANQGLFTFAAERVLPPTKIWAIEPLPYFNRKLNSLFKGIHSISCVLSDSEGYTQFYLPFNNGVADDSLASVNKPSSGKFEIYDVAMRTLDSFTTEKGLMSDTFMKIDVEGHEFAVLNGGRDFISRHVTGMLIEIEERHHNGKKLQELIAPVSDLGFECYYYHPQDKQLVAYSENPQAFQNQADLNTPRYVNNFWFFAKHLAPQNVVASLNQSLH